MIGEISKPPPALGKRGLLVWAMQNFGRTTYPRSDTFKQVEYIEQCARRRGLTTSKIDDLTLFMKNDQVIGAVKGMMPSFTSSLAAYISVSKERSRRILTLHNLPVPQGARFRVNEKEEAKRYFLKRVLDGPQVVKPDTGTGGRAVFVGLKSEDGFETAFSNVEAYYQSEASGGVVVEDFVAGVDVRQIIVRGNFICALSRIPAYVEGDGDSSILDLINVKNKVRKTQPHLKRYPIAIGSRENEFITRNGYSPDSILDEGEILFLNDSANVSSGGEIIDVTSVLGDELKALGEAAARAIPGLGFTGVDFIVDRLDSHEGAKIIEIEAQANIGIHYFPTFGEPRDPAAAILDAFEAGNASV